MKGLKIVLASIVVIMLLLQSVAFAAMPEGTVVIGNKAFDLEYANSAANLAEIQTALADSGNVIYVKAFSGQWYDNLTGLTVNASVIPAVTYKSGTVSGVGYAEGDVDATPTPVPTATPVPTDTPVPTATPVPTDTPAPTATPVPTAVPTPVDTTAPTATAGTVDSWTTLKVTFSEKVVGTPVVAVNGTSEAAANVALSADGTSMTVTRSAGFAGATTYIVVISSGLADEAGNALAANASRSIVKDASTPTTVAFTSTGLIANTSPVTFQVTDQYGQTLSALAAGDVTITATYNGFPIDTETNALNTFSVSLSNPTGLVAGRQIVLTAFKSANMSAIGTATLTVSADAAAATSITTISSAPTTLKAGDAAFDVSVTLKDQYGNATGTVGAGALRWTTSNSAIVAFTAANTAYSAAHPAYVDGNDATDMSITISPAAEGTATITAYLPSGVASKSVTITVAKGDLASITVVGGAAAISIENKAAAGTNPNIYANGASNLRLVFANGNAVQVPVLATDVTFTVTAPTNYNASDITVTKVTDASGYLTGIKVTSNRGTPSTASVDYTLKATVGAINSPNITVTTTINTVVTNVSAITFSASELPATSTVNKAVTFSNTYGEPLSVQSSTITITTSNGALTVTKLKSNGTGGYTAVEVGTDVVIGLGFTATGAGSYTALVATGTSSTVVTVPAVAQAKIAAVTLGSSVNVVKADAYDADSAGIADGIFVTANKAYKTMAISFADQYGNAASLQKQYLTPSGTKLQFAFLKSDGTAAGDTDNVAFVAIYAEWDAAAYVPATFSVGAGQTSTGLAIDKSVAVNTSAVRKVKTISVASTTASLLVGGTVVSNVTVTDQYGNDITKYAGLALGSYLTATPSDAKTSASLAIDTGVIKATITGNTLGSNNVVFAAPADTKDATYTGDVTVAATVYAADSIASVAITNTKDASGYATYPLFDNVGTLGLTQTVTLTNGATVTLDNDNSLLLWSTSNSAVATIGAVLGVKSIIAADVTADAEATIYLTSTNGKQSNIKVKVLDDASALVTSTLAIDTVAADDNTTVAGVQINMAGGAQALLFTAKDQYNVAININEASAQWATSDTAKATIAADGTITPVAAGAVTVSAIYNGQLVQLAVTIVAP